MKECAAAALTAIAVVVGGVFSAQSSRAGDDARNSITVVYNHEASASASGLVSLVERAKTMFPDTPIALVAGGFHLRSTVEQEIRQIASDLERLGVRQIGPSHCTGGTAIEIFRERWGDQFISFDLGDSYRF